MLTFDAVTFQSASAGSPAFGPFSFSFETTGLYYVRGRELLLQELVALSRRRKVPCSGTVSYKGERLSRYHELNRSYEDLVFESGIKYLPQLSVIDNYLCELFAIYKSRDVALDVVAGYLDKLPNGIDPDQTYGQLGPTEKSLIELFAVNFFDYRVVLLKDTITEKDGTVLTAYLKMLEQLRQSMLVIIFGQNDLFEQAEHLGGYDRDELKIDRIGEVRDDEN